VREALAARPGRGFDETGRNRLWSALASTVSRLVIAGLQRPGSVAAGLIMTGGAVAIMVNALGQQARHPSPIFAKAERIPAHRQTEAAPAAPVPPARPPAAAAPPPPQPPARTPVRDQIGEMIRASETTGSASQIRQADARVEPQRVTSAQRALAKLGYGPIKADGVFGQATRQAVERFERERRLPVTGELNQRTARELSSQSGIRVE
jgi:hypothetical protein